MRAIYQSIRYRFLCVVLVCLSSGVYADYFIGMRAGFTGPIEQSNRAYQYGVEAYLAKVNAAGGVKGELIQLEVLDDGFQQAAAANNVQRLVSRKNAIAVLGGGNSITALSMYQAAKSNQTLFIGPIVGVNELYDSRRFMLNTRPSLKSEAEFLADHLQQKGIQGADIVVAGEIGSGEIDAINTALLTQFGSNSIVEYGYPENTLSVSGVASRIVKSARKQVVLTGGFASVAQIISSILVESKGDDWQFYVLSNTDEALLKGLVPAKAVINQIGFLPKLDSNELLVTNYKQDLQSLNGALVPSMKGLEGYLTAQILLSGIKEVVNPFELESPDDLIKLPFNVIRKFAGWVQRGGKDEVRNQLSDALSVMHTISVGLDRPVGYEANRNYLDWQLVID